MTRWLDRIRAFLGRNGEAGIAPGYSVRCACGALHGGPRSKRHQAVACGNCGEPIFIMPRSPLPLVRPPADSGSVIGSFPLRSTGTPPPRRARSVGVPWLAGGVAVLATAIAIGLYYREDWRQSKETSSNGEQLRRQLADGRQALARGSFQQAAAILVGARTLLPSPGEGTFAVEVRDLERLAPQAEMLADLSTESLGEIVERLANLEESERQALMQRRYRGKALIFDTEFRRDAAGRVHVGYIVAGGPHRAVLEMSDLKVLVPLPLDRPTRLFLGVRLSEIERGASGHWIARFVADSGILLTEATILQGLGMPYDEEAEGTVLYRQREWQRPSR